MPLLYRGFEFKGFEVVHDDIIIRFDKQLTPKTTDIIKFTFNRAMFQNMTKPDKIIAVKASIDAILQSRTDVANRKSIDEAAKAAIDTNITGALG